MLLSALRAATRELHQQLERDSAMAVLMDPALDVATYGGLLGRLHAFYRPLDAALAPHAAALPVPPAHRAARLARDLAALGLPVPGADADVAVPTSPDEALGALYVVEGAALGGKVLARQVGRRLGLTPATGLAFFASDGEAAGPRWQAFTAHLDTVSADPEAVVAGAVATFRSFARCLS